VTVDTPSPSLADIIKMVHPKGEDAVREAFYGYLIGKVEGSDSRLPKFVKEFEAFKSGKENKRTLPDSKIDFRRFTALNLSEKEWKEIGSKMGWQALRMNLNTLARHNAFSDKEFAKFVVDKLKNKEDILKSRVFPYQLMTAYLNVDSSVPTSVANSLQDAMEIATENVPSFDGKKVIVAIDSSGSMGSPITGLRAGGVASKVTCNQVASLIAACLLRKNEDNCTIMRFDTSAEILKLNSRDSIMTLASKINRSGGGTACSTPIALANSKNLKADLFILLSDNESWADRTNYWGGNATGVMEEWTKFKKQNPKQFSYPTRSLCCQFPRVCKILEQRGSDNHLFSGL
jgi:60 kDa SS-A/Ro ribonucleoprotein